MLRLPIFKSISLCSQVNNLNFVTTTKLKGRNSGISNFIELLKLELNLKTAKDWNLLTTKQIISYGGEKILNKYPLYKIKNIGCPELEITNENKPIGYWNKEENIKEFLTDLTEKLNLKTIKDWNLLTQKQLVDHGGRMLLDKYSMYEIKCLGFPEGKLEFKKRRKAKDIGYWKKEENIQKFLLLLKEKLNLNNFDDWNSLTQNQIIHYGGSVLLKKYSMYEIKCLGFPEGKFQFNQTKPSGYWKKEENIQKFLLFLTEKLNLNTIDDWNSLTSKQIQFYGGKYLLSKYSLYEIKCMGNKDGKLIYEKSSRIKPFKYWEKEENIQNFLFELSKKLNLKTLHDWNEKLTCSQIELFGGSRLLHKYSIYELKSIGFPSGKDYFKKFQNNQIKPSGYWDKFENIQNFLFELSKKLNLKTLHDWNEKLTQKQILLHGGSAILVKYSMNDLKSIGFPSGKLFFNHPMNQSKYWNDDENIKNFILQLKNHFHLYSHYDWNLLTKNHIKSLGGHLLLNKLSLYQIKSLGCPDGISFLSKPPNYWNNNENIDIFIHNFKQKFNLNSLDDWNRISKTQIYSNGGFGLLSKLKDLNHLHSFNNNELSILSETNKSLHGRSSQRWLFLQIQKLFPDDEIVEDYFHSEISRESGFPVQFDVFILSKKIAFEYHGKQHYEDIPSAFAPLEMYQFRDEEKEKICKQFGIQLIVIPYWWDNNLESLKISIHNQKQTIVN